MPIDTHIDADAASCRMVAQWLGEVAGGAHSTATNINTARTGSEGCWTGSAADAFRSTAGRLRSDGDSVADTARAGSSSVDNFVRSVDAVNGAMGRARGVAVQGGLTILGEVIQDPVSAPAPLAAPDPGSPPPTQQQIAVHQQAVAAANNEKAAYDQAEVVADDARRKYAEAQQRLTDALNKDSTLAGVKNDLVNLQRALGMYSTSYGLADKWGKTADALRNRADIWRNLAGNPMISEANRSLAYSKSIENELASARARGVVGLQNKALGVLTLGLHNTRPVRLALQGLTANPGALVAGGSGVVSKTAEKVLKNVPYAGVLLTGAGVEIDRANGMSTEHAVARNVIPFAAGTAATAILTAAAVTGPVGILALGVGIVVSIGVGHVVDSWYD